MTRNRLRRADEGGKEGTNRLAAGRARADLEEEMWGSGYGSR